jgi:hypothetical protein
MAGSAVASAPAAMDDVEIHDSATVRAETGRLVGGSIILARPLAIAVINVEASHGYAGSRDVL